MSENDWSLIAAVPNCAKPLAGLHAYTQKSLLAGTTLDVHVSSTVP
jgi:hypothetical protein